MTNQQLANTILNRINTEIDKQTARLAELEKLISEPTPVYVRDDKKSFGAVTALLCKATGETSEQLFDRLGFDEWTYLHDAEEIVCEELYQEHRIEVIYKQEV